MKKTLIPIALMLSLGLLASLSIGGKAMEVSAEPESSEQIESQGESSEEASEESSEESAESTEPIESSEESESEAPTVHVYDYGIKEAVISFRDSESSSYAIGGNEIGFYYLSADGWDEGDDYVISMTIKGNVTTKLESKIVYIYEYKPTLVRFNGQEIAQGENRIYTLSRPAEKGQFDLEIAFTKTIVTNPVDLTHINWASLLTVQNLMTIGSWAIIVVGIIVLYALNMKYKRSGTTTLKAVKKELTDAVENEYGAVMAQQVGDLFDTTVKPVFGAIDSKLSKMDSNQMTLVRCLLLMQEDTPEARLAITECLSKLDVSADEEAEKVKRIIEEQQAKYNEEVEKRLSALEEAKKANEKWTSENAKSEGADKVANEAAEEKEEAAKSGYDGTSI